MLLVRYKSRLSRHYCVWGVFFHVLRPGHRKSDMSLEREYRWPSKNGTICSFGAFFSFSESYLSNF